MKPKVYIESSVISYLTARPSNDLIKAARQTITEDWWSENLHYFSVFVSELVEEEISQGHPEAAARRLAITASIKNLSISENAQTIAEHLITAQAVPAKSQEDALHIGIAAANGIDFLLTWNFKHINNACTKAAIREVIEGLDRRSGHLRQPSPLESAPWRGPPDSRPEGRTPAVPRGRNDDQARSWLPMPRTLFSRRIKGNIMRDDPIVEEIRRYRAEHAARNDNDLKKICDALRERERQSKKETVQFAPKLLSEKQYSS